MRGIGRKARTLARLWCEADTPSELPVICGALTPDHARQPLPVLCLTKARSAARLGS